MCSRECSRSGRPAPPRDAERKWTRCAADTVQLSSGLFSLIRERRPSRSLSTRRGGEADMEPPAAEDVKVPVLHIVVVGFHHKRGCQVGEAAASYRG